MSAKNLPARLSIEGLEGRDCPALWTIGTEAPAVTSDWAAAIKLAPTVAVGELKQLTTTATGNPDTATGRVTVSPGDGSRIVTGATGRLSLNFTAPAVGHGEDTSYQSGGHGRAIPVDQF